ncbi:MAG: neutral/alkaline non-lysosomal ceramidase N-terminal domain-containing protein [Acidobacteria bacterium]|nr:neutral/alkaline non-lysosomal ceramidase N-terminal domain-containing protein [Acidobacteriota bacterium]MCI0724716.1 neutral/alkaline non-lysosomal ceramidase N-terminal domain-containing protein [Acidobacteriota bacterium]
MMIQKTRWLVLGILCVGVMRLDLRANEKSLKTWKAGLAKVVITPEQPIWMSGYARRNKPSEGKVHDLYAKALALEDPAGKRLVLVTTDLIGFSRSLAEQVAQGVRRRAGLARERLLLTSSHTHTGPVVRDSLITMYELNPQQVEVVSQYSAKLAEQLIGLVEQALEDVSTAKISYGTGQADFAVNRRAASPTGVKIGVNPEGPVDRSVPVLRIDDRHGNLRAVVMGYACHNTTLTGEFYQLSGDYSGFAQYALEQQYPGALALFVMGCGADANPNPRSTLELAERHGKALAKAVSHVLDRQLQTVQASLKTKLEFVKLPVVVPSREEFQTRLQDKDVYRQRHARRMLQLLDERGKIPATYSYPIQVCQLGRDLTLVALAGEVVVDYALRLRQELKVKTLWPIGYANDVFAYIPSVRILREGGYEALSSGIYYGMPGPFAEPVEELIISKVKDMASKVQGQ